MTVNLQDSVKKDMQPLATLSEKPVAPAPDAPKNLTPPENERAKTRMEKALDWSYTMNHAIYCLSTDFISGPLINAWLQNSPKFKNGVHTIQDKTGLTWLGQRWDELKKTTALGKVFGDEKKAHNDYGSTNAVSRFFNKHQKTRSAVCEVAGDTMAVPFTVMVQRIFPGFMNAIRKVSEKVLGGGFRSSAERVASQWAFSNGHGIDSKEYKDKVEELYRYEIDHTPQAYVWSASAIGFNALAHKAVGNNNSLGVIAAAKTADALGTLVTVMLFRGFFPGAAHRWDKFTSKDIIEPLSKKMGVHTPEDSLHHDKTVEEKKSQWAVPASPYESATPSSEAVKKILQRTEPAMEEALVRGF